MKEARINLSHIPVGEPRTKERDYFVKEVNKIVFNDAHLKHVEVGGAYQQFIFAIKLDGEERFASASILQTSLENKKDPFNDIDIPLMLLVNGIIDDRREQETKEQEPPKEYEMNMLSEHPLRIEAKEIPK